MKLHFEQNQTGDSQIDNSKEFALINSVYGKIDFDICKHERVIVESNFYANIAWYIEWQKAMYFSPTIVESWKGRLQRAFDLMCTADEGWAGCKEHEALKRFAFMPGDWAEKTQALLDEMMSYDDVGRIKFVDYISIPLRYASDIDRYSLRELTCHKATGKLSKEKEYFTKDENGKIYSRMAIFPTSSLPKWYGEWLHTVDLERRMIAYSWPLFLLGKR